MNVLSLFSGIGGLELGLERAGMTVVGQVEIDPFCRSVLAKHWPEVPRHDDVRTAVEWWLGRARPAVDVVCGGFPCQPVSLAGKGLAQADERWLWPAAWAVIRDLRPRWAVLENVPGLLGRGLGDVLGDLAEIGYDAEWDCLPAAAFGAPHRRDRVFVVAHSGSDGVRHESGRSNGAGRAGATVAGHNGAARHLAHAAGEGLEGAGLQGRPTDGGMAMANPAGVRRDRSPTLGRGPSAGTTQGRVFQPPRGHTWTAEPDVGRVAHGIPRRVDRLRALGNAVVPQVAEHVGRLVMALEEAK